MLENKVKLYKRNLNTQIFIVSTIEKRLQELQRKLSEIAEIPKILSSTLATVSQTFDKLTTTHSPPVFPSHCQSGNCYCPHFNGNEQKRKLSYDEDVYDYELSDEADRDDAAEKEEFDAKEAYLQLKRYAARQRKSKEETPESDYASESNYQQNPNANKDQNVMKSDSDDDDDDDDNDVTDDDDNATPNETFNDEDDEKNCDMYEEFNLSVLKIPLGHANNESDTEEYEEGDNDNDDDEDFLTTTFTWNLRNKPKLQISDSDNNDNVNKRDSNDEGNDKFNGSQQKSLNKSKDMLCQQRHIKADTPEKEQKLDKLERSWPWADREKIIYKQSTCHLVPQKPLGLIEQRIQLLAKRNLLEHINKTKNS